MSQNNPNTNVDTGAGNAPQEPKTGEDYAAYAEQLLDGVSDYKATEQTSRGNTIRKQQASSFTEQVNKLLKEATDAETGKLVFPDGISDELKYAVTAEKKFRDTQSGFTKSQMTLKEIEAENEALREQLAKNSATRLEIPAEKAAELEDLMLSDPQAWRLEMNRLETEHTTQVQKGLKEQMSEVRQSAGAKAEMERRDSVLASFNEGREVPITPEVLDNDIPPRITKKLADGLLTFEGYLAEADEYLSKGRVVGNPDADTGTSLNSAAGGSNPPGYQAQQEQEIDYTQVLF